MDSLGNIHIPLCAVLAPANEDGENRTILLIGEFGNAATSPPIEVRVVDDLFTTDTLSTESACSDIINLNGISTTNVVPLADGPTLFFAQRIDGNLSECNLGAQTIQLAWNGGITPYISGDTESDLFQYYIGYSDSSGVLIPHLPISIADLGDNDNFHQLCFSTSDEIVKISMMANTVEDPNQDPNLYSEVEVSYCTTLTSIKENLLEESYTIYPNPFSDELSIKINSELRRVDIYSPTGKKVFASQQPNSIISLNHLTAGIYFLRIETDVGTTVKKIIKN